jgi:hypothetical protein
LTSFSDRRVLDELDPDSTQTVRDQQPIHRPEGDPITPRFYRQPHCRPENFIESIHGGTRKRSANSRLARVAFKLEARLTQSTILTNVFRHAEHPFIRSADLKACKLFNFERPGCRIVADVSGDIGRKWQKN